MENKEEVIKLFYEVSELFHAAELNGIDLPKFVDDFWNRMTIYIEDNEE